MTETIEILSRMVLGMLCGMFIAIVCEVLSFAPLNGADLFAFGLTGAVASFVWELSKIINDEEG